MDTIDLEVRQACKRGDLHAAATAAIRTYGAEVRGYVRRHLRDIPEVEDVFALVCEQLWRGLASFAWQASLRTWIYAVTRNAVISFVRKRRRERARGVWIELDEMQIELELGATDTFAWGAAGEELARVRAALDPEDQELLVLRIDRKLAWRDIARELHPDATPATLTRRAAALRKRLERLKGDLRVALHSDACDPTPASSGVRTVSAT